MSLCECSYIAISYVILQVNEVTLSVIQCDLIGSFQLVISHSSNNVQHFIG